MKIASVQIGLVGYGAWGENILRTLLTLGVRPHVADPLESRCRAAIEAGAQSAANHFADWPPMDGLIIATPAVTHCEIVLDVLGRFPCPVFVEKPLAADSRDAQRILKAGRTRVFVMHVWRYHPGIQALGELAANGEIGPITGVRTVRTNWTSPRRDVDSLWNLAPHDISIGLAILGFIPEPRFALAERQDSRTCGLIGVCGHAPWLALEVSNRYRDKRREVRVHGHNGVAVMSDPDSGLIEITRECSTGGPLESCTERRVVSSESALSIELRTFLDYLQGGPPPPTDAAEGVAIVNAVERLQQLAGH